MVKTEKTTDDNDVSDGVNNIEKHAADLAIRLTKEVLDHPSSPDPEKCIDLLKEMANLTVSMALWKEPKLGSFLRRLPRLSSDTNELPLTMNRLFGTQPWKWPQSSWTNGNLKLAKRRSQKRP